MQKKMKNLNVELIVRGPELSLKRFCVAGYLWGSMAAAYEKGDRAFCGLQLPEGSTPKLIRRSLMKFNDVSVLVS